jgi:hypothetical protein
VRAGEPVSLTVALEREGEGELRPVDAPLFPGRKDENWWLVVGDPASNSLLAIKRVTLQVGCFGGQRGAGRWSAGLIAGVADLPQQP